MQELSYGVMRFYPRLRVIADALLKKPLKRKDQDLYALILIGIYQQIYLNIPPHAAVAETVEASRQLGKKWAAGLINGVLRNFQRQREPLLKVADKESSGRYAWPDWLLSKIQTAWPEYWQTVVEATNQRPPMVLRVNSAKITRDDYLGQLNDAGISANPLPLAPSGILLEQPSAVERLPGFDQGLFSVQDSGAQLAAELLDVQSGQTVLDACAAPGGKTCHLLELMPDIALTAVDIDNTRLERVRENLQRLDLNASVVVGDASRPTGAWSEVSYDRILLDVPCSATGVIRRHPDIKILRRADDIPALVKTQADILDEIWPLLSPDGMLLYVTCSLLPVENEHQIAEFLKRQSDAREVPIKADWGLARPLGRQTLPGLAEMDGFYYACLSKERSC